MLLNAYYFQHHMYTCRPAHIREDMAWLADAGAQAITLAVLEQDLEHARSNLRIVIEEAHHRGMQVFAVPSRWAGLFAGAPKVPSHFTATHPQTWILDSQGQPVFNTVTGPVSSWYHPQTMAFFLRGLERLLSDFAVTGIVWDEPKMLGRADHSPYARRQHPEGFSQAAHHHHVAQFLQRLGQAVRDIRPDATLSLFLQANTANESLLETMAGIPALDYFGCDGRPWASADGGTLEAPEKTLLDQAPRFLAAASGHEKKGVMLVENHNLRTADMSLMRQRLPEVLRLPAEQMIFYFYPRNVEEPEQAMQILSAALRSRRRAAEPL